MLYRLINSTSKYVPGRLIVRVFWQTKLIWRETRLCLTSLLAQSLVPALESVTLRIA
jgi:hypothetical protein